MVVIGKEDTCKHSCSSQIDVRRSDFSALPALFVPFNGYCRGNLHCFVKFFNIICDAFVLNSLAIEWWEWQSLKVAWIIMSRGNNNNLSLTAHSSPSLNAVQ